MARRKLPLLVEHSLATVVSARVEVSTDFERKLRDEASKTGKPVSCESGCAHCCYHPIHITALEGAVLYRQLVARGRWTPSFQETIRVHAARTYDLPYELWLLSMMPCPLLDEKTAMCTAYDARPLVCRTTFSTGDPYNCHPHRITDSGLVSKREPVETFHARVRASIKRHGITMIIMPLSVALLIGEKIVTGEIDIEAADVEVLKQYFGSSL
jgi:Fe-S-cluster containining protein